MRARVGVQKRSRPRTPAYECRTGARRARAAQKPSGHRSSWAATSLRPLGRRGIIPIPPRRSQQPVAPGRATCAALSRQGPCILPPGLQGRDPSVAEEISAPRPKAGSADPGGWPSARCSMQWPEGAAGHKQSPRRSLAALARRPARGLTCNPKMPGPGDDRTIDGVRAVCPAPPAGPTAAGGPLRPVRMQGL